MSNCGPTRQLTRRPLNVNMDPLFIPGSLSKLIDALLCYFDPIADPNFSPTVALISSKSLNIRMVPPAS
jgi:hypothetical protein